MEGAVTKMKDNIFIIAEMSGNHNGSLDRALEIIDAAAVAGVDALKLQTYTADTMTLDIREREFVINDPDSLWYNRSLYDLYQEAHTPWEWHKPIYDRCKELGIVCFSTPLDLTAVDFLEELGNPIYKIASFENNDLQLLERVAKTGKPVIMSTGITTLDTLTLAVETLKNAGCKDLTLLKCTSSYPSTPENSNLLTMQDMKERFYCKVGLSDHTMGIGAAIASVALDGSVIEKHFTLSRAEGGVDAAFSIEPAEMKQLVKEVKNASLALGKVDYNINEQEKNSLCFKRSLYFVKDMQEGDVITSDSIRSIRPGFGLEPKYYKDIIGKKLVKDVGFGEATTSAHFESE